jgi:hypothetical protein
MQWKGYINGFNIKVFRWRNCDHIIAMGMLHLTRLLRGRADISPVSAIVRRKTVTSAIMDKCQCISTKVLLSWLLRNLENINAASITPRFSSVHVATHSKVILQHTKPYKARYNKKASMPSCFVCVCVCVCVCVWRNHDNIKCRGNATWCKCAVQ